MSNVSQDAAPGRADADVLFSMSRSLDCLALKLAPEQRKEVLETALLRRAREIYQIVQQEANSKDPAVFRTVRRTGADPGSVHWLVGGKAAAGQRAAFEDLYWLACGAEVNGIWVGDEDRWQRSTVQERPITCPACLRLFQAVDEA